MLLFTNMQIGNIDASDGLVLGQGLMVISTTDILLFAKVSSLLIQVEKSFP